MKPIEAVKHCLRNYRNFRGRASRSEFWWFLGFQQVCALVIGVISLVIFNGDTNLKIYPTIVFNLMTALPFAAVFARRLHDVNWSGWWQLVFWAVFPLGYFQVPKFMLGNTVPSFVNWGFIVTALLFVVMYFVVIAQWFRPGKKTKPTEGIPDSEIILAGSYGIAPFDWVPSPKNQLYGRCP